MGVAEEVGGEREDGDDDNAEETNAVLPFVSFSSEKETNKKKMKET